MSFGHCIDYEQKMDEKDKEWFFRCWIHLNFERKKRRNQNTPMTSNTFLLFI